jgi:hypothetical protein
VGDAEEVEESVMHGEMGDEERAKSIVLYENESVSEAVDLRGRRQTYADDGVLGGEMRGGR